MPDNCIEDSFEWTLGWIEKYPSEKSQILGLLNIISDLQYLYLYNVLKHLTLQDLCLHTPIILKKLFHYRIYHVYPPRPTPLMLGYQRQPTFFV
jgi:hypothetical protein